jgi:GxxExxY protein
VKKLGLIEEELSGKIIGAAIEVHRTLGAGLLESTYQICLAHEMTLRSIPFEREKILPVTYKDVTIDAAYRLDFLVANSVIVELKAVNMIEDAHKAQILTYLKLTGCKLGLLINFSVRMLKDGVSRLSYKHLLREISVYSVPPWF